ncbi:MAG: two-component regulator propeller domain-containing protein [Saprospiraceae bacterium]|nr:response regulator [Lewinella sp.]
MKSILSTFFLVLSGLVLQAQKLDFEHISTRQGLSHSTVYAITQDQRGFMWIGTREGLNRYDSYDLKTYYTETGLPSNEIQSLLATGDQLYVGTTNGACKYLPAQDVFVPLSEEGSPDGIINEIYEAKDSVIFICAQKGLFRLEPSGKIRQIIDQPGARSICNFKTNVYWLVLNDEVLLINHLGEQIKTYQPVFPKHLIAEGRRHTLHKIYKDSENQIWLVTNRGLFTYSPERDEFEYVSLSHRENLIEANVIRAIAEDPAQKLWLGTELGLFVYDKKERTAQHLTQSFTQPNSLSDKSIYSIFFSRDQMAWIGTYFGGLNYGKPYRQGFYKMLPAEPGRSISGKAVSQLMEGDQGRLWIGTEDGGITIYDKKQQQYRYLQSGNEWKEGLSCNNVHALHQDKQGYIWIGTFLGGLNRYDPQTGSIRIYKNNKADPHSLSNDYVYSLLQDGGGQLWIGTQGGLNLYDYQQDRFTVFRPEVLGNKFIYDILEDQRGDLWFCSRWSGIYRYRPASGALVHFAKAEENKHGLACNQIISAFEDSRGILWFGSLNGGLIRYDPTAEHFTAVTQTDGLPNNNVYGILEDGQQYLWLTTNKGLCRYQPENGTFEHFTTADGLSDNQFNFKSFYRDEQGWMYFGSVNGLNYFHPDSTRWDTPAPGLYFTKFKLFNKEVPVEPKGILEQDIDQTSRLVLRYSQNVITFEYVGINYASKGNNHYDYYLEGFEENWNEVGNKQTATYTNLSPGDYVFHLRASSGRNSSSFSERSINLTVLPPFWQSREAILIYSLFFVLLIFLYSRFVRFVHQQKLAVQMERLENEKIREINQHKLDFFTFISHEFKTPLTLIIASIEKFLQPASARPTHPDELLSVKRNANRLHHLVEQLMEFRKIETNHTSLNLSKGDIILFLRDTFSAFAPLFEDREIIHHFRSNLSEYHCYFDPDKLEMIVTNLLSNAVQHTDKEGEVSLGVEVRSSGEIPDQKELYLSVSDTGSGIDKENSELVFTPFYQSGQEDHRNKRGGSGIGLALVKSLVQYLKGRLHLDSKPGRGTTITIRLPLHHKPLSVTGEPIVVNGNKSLVLHPGLFPMGESQEIEDEKGHLLKEQHLLIVEDDRDLLKFLHKHFSRKYQVQLARDGREALEKVKRSLPDVIISDAKMPRMDGIALCKAIKSDPKTSHIPFLLVTAKTSEANRLEGLKVGANAYITKPFNLKELDLLIGNTLIARKHLQSRFAHLQAQEAPTLPPNNQDREFLHQLTELVEKHYNDPNFTIAELSQLMGISRSMLHLKMKKVVQISASEFIRNRRMDKAIRFLEEGHSIAEVAYKVGFNDPNYFSKVFKKHYKMLPSEYV